MSLFLIFEFFFTGRKAVFRESNNHSHLVEVQLLSLRDHLETNIMRTGY